MSTPRISVIIPAYNSALFLTEAVDSVFSQNYNNLELIIVNDGSTDATRDVIFSFGQKVRSFDITHAGAAAARNHGVHQATGDYLAFLDADDVWAPEKLHNQLDCLQSNSVDAVFTAIVPFLDPSLQETKKINSKPVQGLSASTMMIAKEKFLEIGLFKTSYQLGEFIEWFMRAKRVEFRYEVLMNIQTKRRIHLTNTSARCKMEKRDYLAVITDTLRWREKDVSLDREPVLTV